MTGLLPCDNDQWYQLAKDGFIAEPMRERWEEPSFYIEGPVTRIRTDFIHVTAGILAFTRRVYDSPIGEMFAECGEILRADVSDTGEQIYIFNPLMCYNCLDRKHSKLRMAGEVLVQVLKYQFFPERIGYSLFKIPDLRRAPIFTISGRVPEGNEFYSHYKAAGFTGLKFERVWTANK